MLTRRTAPSASRTTTARHPLQPRHQGRLSTVTDAKTNLTTYLYDANDNVTQVKQLDRSDAAGTTQEFTSTFSYDELDRCVVESDNVGNLNQYAYDSRGNLVRHTDPRGILRGWRYDGLNRAIVIEADLDGDGEFDPISDLGMSRMFDDNSRLSWPPRTRTATSPSRPTTRWTGTSPPPTPTAPRAN
ncbi:MAG: RHS repeat protein [Verrucomicrobia bacterium]|nr:RHS repeat protein [Verrucomicrobiota bacterium]